MLWGGPCASPNNMGVETSYAWPELFRDVDSCGCDCRDLLADAAASCAAGDCADVNQDYGFNTTCYGGSSESYSYEPCEDNIVSVGGVVPYERADERSSGQKIARTVKKPRHESLLEHHLD